jgi:hypothetical protein
VTQVHEALLVFARDALKARAAYLGSEQFGELAHQILGAYFVWIGEFDDELGIGAPQRSAERNSACFFTWATKSSRVARVPCASCDAGGGAVAGLAAGTLGVATGAAGVLTSAAPAFLLSFSSQANNTRTIAPMTPALHLAMR